MLPDQRQFGELFASTSDKLGNWCAFCRLVAAWSPTSIGRPAILLLSACSSALSLVHAHQR